MKYLFFRITLMIFVFLRIMTGVTAQDAGVEVEVTVKTYPENPSVLSFWTLSLLADHPVPDEVNVMVPPLPGSLLLDRFRKVPSEPGKTLVEYRFLLNSAGTITLDPFRVVTPLGAAFTAPLTLTVRKARESQEPFPLVWEGRRTVPAGEKAVFRLRAEGGKQVPVFPPVRALMPEVPRDLILEGEEPSGMEKEAGIVFILKLTALGPGTFSIPGRTLGAGNTVFAIPVLGISVEPAAFIAANGEFADNALSRPGTGGGRESGSGKNFS